MLHGFNEIHAMTHAQGVNRAIDILRIGARIDHRNTKHFRFETETRNGIELAIVPDQIEGLSALEDRIGVSAIARVAHCDR